MRKILWLLLIMPVTSFAQQASQTKDFLTCHHPEPFLKTHRNTNFEESCKDENNFYQFIAVPSFKAEADYFTEQVLRRIYADNRSNPNFVAEKATLDLRKYRECLLSTCFAIFTQCGKNLGKFESLRPGDWCVAQAAELVQLAKFQVQSLAQATQARKERTLLSQKFWAIFGRFERYTHGKALLITNLIERFVEKVTHLVLDPVTDHTFD